MLNDLTTKFLCKIPRINYHNAQLLLKIYSIRTYKPNCNLFNEMYLLYINKICLGKNCEQLGNSLHLTEDICKNNIYINKTYLCIHLSLKKVYQFIF